MLEDLLHQSNFVVDKGSEFVEFGSERCFVEMVVVYETKMVETGFEIFVVEVVVEIFVVEVIVEIFVVEVVVECFVVVGQTIVATN